MPTETDAQFEETPSGWAKRWSFEFKAAEKLLEDFFTQGAKVNERFLDTRAEKSDEQRWNLFTSNVQTQEAMLFGQVPVADVSRRFADSRDNTARIGAEMMQRLLNTDLQHDGEGEVQAYRHALSDRLRPAIGTVRYRYDCEMGESESKPAIYKQDEQGNQVLGDDGQPVQLAPEVPAQPMKVREDIECIYTYWKDQLWDAGAHTFHDARWWAFRALMSQEEATEKFGEEVAKVLPKAPSSTNPDNKEGQPSTPWDRIAVWEVWDKEHEKVFWYVKGHPTVLRPVDVDPECVNADGSLTDPLGLEGFWPFPRPLMANLTTDKLVPKADFHFAQDLYNEIDALSSRIYGLVQAVKVAGLYDQAIVGLDRLIEASGNVMIPVPSSVFVKLSERGGLPGAVVWMPLEQIVAAIEQLGEQRSVLVSAMQQITGWSDLMRGQQAENGTPGEAQVKARFASVRLQKLQDELVEFVSSGQRIKAEIISKHFDLETIIERSNAMRMFEDPAAVQQAAQFLKDSFSCYRIAVKPDSVSMQDFAALKAVRTELLGAVGAFFQQMMPLLQAMPQALPFVLKLLQWAVSGLKGSSEVQGIIDQAISAAEQAQQQAAANPQAVQPDPKLIANQQKAQTDAQKIQLQAQADLQHMQAETAALAERDRNRAALDIQKTQVQERMRQQHAAAAMPFGPLGGGMP